MKLLQIDSSARRNSVSRLLTATFVQAWKSQIPEGEVIRRDLAATPFSPITDEWQQAAANDAGNRTESQQRLLVLSEALTDELIAAQTIVIGAPMYNYTISSLLKAWIDQIVRPGKTIQYGPEGAKGLLNAKKVFVLTARGGAYLNGTPRALYDFQEPYLRAILGFIGLTDVTFIHAENQQRPDQAEQSRQAALAQITEAATAASVAPPPMNL